VGGGHGKRHSPHRVLNPLRQAQRFDPKGEYVRRYVPELEGLTTSAAVHEPWKLSTAERKLLDYSERLVDHVSASERFRQQRGG
jgi:deoxyribodipyrimidine photo-lyase